MYPIHSLAFVALCALLPADGPAASEAPWQIERDGPRVTVRIPGDNSVVTWSEITAALVEVADYDGNVLNDAISYGELDLESRRTRTWLRALNLILPSGINLHPERAGETWQLRIDVDLDALDDSTRNARRSMRDWVSDHFDGSETIEYGLKWHELAAASPQRSKVVILIHGYTSTSVALGPLADALAEQGYVCGFLEYPNDGPIVDAGEFLSLTLAEDETLTAMLAEDDSRSITIITHSMGGLVARWMLEHSELSHPAVDQLIMVAPPSQGSNIAYLPGALDVFEHWLVLGQVDFESFIERSFADGLEEAHNDLRPTSRLLRELNARPRCEAVDYTILLGNAGLVDEAGFVLVQAAWEELCERSQAAQFASPRIEMILDDPQELMKSEGDGLVAISRGRLDGVEDVTVLPFHHGNLARGFDTPGRQELFQTIADRLAK